MEYQNSKATVMWGLVLFIQITTKLREKVYKTIPLSRAVFVFGAQSVLLKTIRLKHEGYIYRTVCLKARGKHSIRDYNLSRILLQLLYTEKTKCLKQRFWKTPQATTAHEETDGTI